MPPTPAERGERRNGLSRGSAMTWPPVPPSQLMERRDADGETFYATDTAIAGVALQWRGKDAGDRAGAGHRTEHGPGGTWPVQQRRGSVGPWARMSLTRA